MTTKEILLLLLLTVVMGYILGLMISTTVNYKLNDIMVNFPRPIVKLGSGWLRRNGVNNQQVVINQPSGEIEEGFTSKINRKKKSKKSKSKPIIEKFENAVEDVSNKSYIEQQKEYNHTLKDPNMDAYARLFNISDKNTKDDSLKFTYSAYNMEDVDDNYKIINTKITSGNDKGLIDNIKKSINKVKELIPRKKRKMTNNCQKKWQNCTSSHKVVLK